MLGQHLLQVGPQTHVARRRATSQLRVHLGW